jgi:hypothetical protein
MLNSAVSTPNSKEPEHPEDRHSHACQRGCSQDGWVEGETAFRPWTACKPPDGKLPKQCAEA